MGGHRLRGQIIRLGQSEYPMADWKGWRYRRVSKFSALVNVMPKSITNNKGQALPRVLIVEDDAGIREFLAEVLDDEGLTVVTAENGSDAIAWVKRHRPALVILDLQLPAIHGDQVLQVLRALYGDEVPIITMTALERSTATMRRIGASAHLRKPFQIEDMLSAVHAHIEQ
jgi:CheY-like chemotaxis protein